MESRNQYLKVLRERYLKAKAKKEETQILDEYCRNTGQARKYVIRKMQFGADLNRLKEWLHGRCAQARLERDRAERREKAEAAQAEHEAMQPSLFDL